MRRSNNTQPYHVNKSDRPTVQKARFALGQLVKHVHIDYRGIIYDVDPVFSQSDDWFAMMDDDTLDKNSPWYHVLVDGEKYTTYVAEANLIACRSTFKVNHPLYKHLFDTHDDNPTHRNALN